MLAARVTVSRQACLLVAVKRVFLSLISRTDSLMSGTTSDVILVARASNEEVRVCGASLAAASPVWQERFGISQSAVVRSEEDCTLFELRAFVGCLTLTSGAPSLPHLMERPRVNGTGMSVRNLRWLTAALPLIHKYDCKGLLAIVIRIADDYYPECRLHVSLGHGRNAGAPPPMAVARWLTQAHIEYILRIQELYWSVERHDNEHDNVLSPVALALLSHALTAGGLTWTTGRRMKPPNDTPL